MTAETAETAARLERDHAGAIRASRRQMLWPLGLLVAVVVYLSYAWFAFDVPRLLAQSRLDRGLILAADSVAHKIHVRQDTDSEELEVSLEGTRGQDLAPLPDWITRESGRLRVALGDGIAVERFGNTTVLEGPGFEPITVTLDGERVVTRGALPEWASANERKFEARPSLFKRVRVTKSKLEIHRYFFGWENFFFEFGSPLRGSGPVQLAALALSDQRLDADMPNWQFIFQSFWYNMEWQHGDVYRALLETVIMATLGTIVGSLVALPLAFVAAANFNRIMPLRMAVRRLFDFLRGIDMLIWSLIFIRAFGLGPLTGVLAIAFTITGELGKLFSEAIENIEDKPVDGVKSTGASPVQSYRFGVIPQILPIFMAQSLYYLESNTRSATIIGALGAGGIGLKLVETLRTGRDWENTLYIILLTLLVVVLMDIGSGWLRRRLIAPNPERRPEADAATKAAKARAL